MGSFEVCGRDCRFYVISDGRVLNRGGIIWRIVFKNFFGCYVENELCVCGWRECK